MSTQAQFHRRKSLSHLVAPALPKPTPEDHTGIRTQYNQLGPLSQQLNKFRRKTYKNSFGTLETESSYYRNEVAVEINMRQENTKKDQQKGNQKQVGLKNLQMNFKSFSSINLKTPDPFTKSSPLLMSHLPKIKSVVSDYNHSGYGTETARLPEDEKLQQHERIKQSNLNSSSNMGGQNQYQPGFVQVPEQPAEQLDPAAGLYCPNSKSYSDHDGGQSFLAKRLQAKADSRYYETNFKLLQEIRQQKEQYKLTRKYQASKAELNKFSMLKVERAKSIAQLSRASSLPKIAAEKNSIVIPSFEQLAKLRKQQNPEEVNREMMQLRAKLSFSIARHRLDNKTNQIDHQHLQEQQISEVARIQETFRLKGLHVRPEVLKKGLLTTRGVPDYLIPASIFPAPSLLSKPGEHEAEAATGKVMLNSARN